MNAKQETQAGPLSELRADLALEDQAAENRAKLGIGVRIVLILFVAGYMSWISSSISGMDAAVLTQAAAASLETRLPELRVEMRDHALALAPELTDRARDLLLEMPAQLRAYLEAELLEQTDELLVRLETEVDLAIATVIDDQIALVQAQMPYGSPEEQLDAIVLGVSDAFRETMNEALDELYHDYSAKVREVNADLDRLLRADDLSESEKIDKQLIEVWMVLANEYDLADPGKLIAGR